jgi:hypothetical protein
MHNGAAQVTSTNRAAQVTSSYCAKTSPATEMAATAAPACERISRHASVCNRHSGSDDRDSGQHKFVHGRFLSSRDELVNRSPRATAWSIDFSADM